MLIENESLYPILLSQYNLQVYYMHYRIITIISLFESSFYKHLQYIILHLSISMNVSSPSFPNSLPTSFDNSSAFIADASLSEVIVYVVF
jgi:hypothetical protein